jgi:trehalose synthase
MLEAYARVVGEAAVDQLRQLARPLAGAALVHVNSTRVGGGVAEILAKLVPLTGELGLEVSWEVIEGDAPFFACTKTMHNTLQGARLPLTEEHVAAYEATNARNAERLAPILRDADFVFIHDPQPAALIRHVQDRKGKWIWRCHIDASRPQRQVWSYLRQHVALHDASIFSLPEFTQRLPHPQYIIPPSIDPFSEKNVELEAGQIERVRRELGLDPTAPLVVQVSRFDRFKDPLGVLEAHRLARRYVPDLQLVLAGGGAADDPEGAAVLAEVRAAAGNDGQVHLLDLPADAHLTINALQRMADVVMQKSLREGFGLTVTEALWKGRPVIGGNVGGIRLQIVDGHTGYLVDTPEGAALRLRYLLRSRPLREEMGRKGRAIVRENFLLTRQLLQYLALAFGIRHGARGRIDLST